MPLLGFSLAKLFQFPPEIGAGLVLIGSCSSGLASNVMTYLAKGNLALSVTLTAIATAIAPAITPLWMKLLAGTMVEVNMLQMSLTIVKIVLVPILAAFVHEFLCSQKRNVRIAVWCSSLVGLAWLAFLMSGGWTKMTSEPGHETPR
ncbi:MAG: bile acid:sodium symporter [Pirellulaceae bacterium]